MADLNWDLLARIFQGLLTPIVGGIALFIAWQQHKSSRAKILLDVYDRRLRVYQELVAFLRAAGANANLSMDELRKFVHGTAEAAFLFDASVARYLREVYLKGLTLHRTKGEYRDFTQEHPDGYDHERVVEEMHTALRWLVEQDEASIERFRPHLNLGI